METRKRSLIKAVGWRILSFTGTSFILWIFGRTALESFIEAFTISLGAIVLYYLYERLWQRIKWGKVHEDSANKTRLELCIMCKWCRSIDVDGYIDCVKNMEGKVKMYCPEFMQTEQTNTVNLRNEFNYLISMGSKLDEYAGKWIAVVGRRIVAVGDNAEEVFMVVKNKYPDKKPLIARIPKNSQVLFEIVSHHNTSFPESVDKVGEIHKRA